MPVCGLLTANTAGDPAQTGATVASTGVATAGITVTVTGTLVGLAHPFRLTPI